MNDEMERIRKELTKTMKFSVVTDGVLTEHLPITIYKVTVSPTCSIPRY